MKRIAFVSTEFYPLNGGVANALTEFATALGKTGKYDVHVVTLRHDKSHKPRETYKNVKVYRTCASNYVIFTLKSITRLIAINPDIVFGEYIWTGGTVSGIYGNLFRCLSITQSHGTDVHEIYKLYHRFFTQIGLRFNKIVLTTNNEHKQRLMHFYNRKIQLLPNIVSEPHVPSREKCRKFLGMKRDEFHALAIGRMVKVNNVETKGISYILEALMNVKNIKLHLLGDGPLRKTYENFVRKNNLEKNVFFHKKVPRDMAFMFMRACDVLIFPSLEEGLSMAFIEALASGLPIISTKIGGAADYIVDGKNGFFIDRANSKSIEIALRKIMSDSRLRNSMARNALATYLSNFTCESVVNKFEDIIVD
jgi:glycosyltransferase involved in cell wall biosynthesis